MQSFNDADELPDVPICGPMLFAVGFSGGLIMTYALDLIFPGAVIARVLASGFGSAGTMLAYAHFAGDKVNRRICGAVSVTTVLASWAVTHLEVCCHRHDNLLMALLPNAASVLVYTSLRDVKVLRAVTYGHSGGDDRDHDTASKKRGSRSGRSARNASGSQRQGRRSQNVRKTIATDQKGQRDEDLTTEELDAQIQLLEAKLSNTHGSGMP